MTGRLQATESFGAVDGPGVRFVAFLHGCRWRCGYCHNPETWAGAPAEEIEPAALLGRALRYRPYWGGNGGVTLSGGEPLLQPGFVAEFFELARAAGASTCLDTAGGPFRRGDAAQARALAAADTVMLDLKLMDAAAHRALTGADNAPALDCARYLAERGARVWIRRVLVPGVTDSEADLRATGRFIASLGNVERVEVLPYHPFGEAKWRQFGLASPLAGSRAPAEAELARARALIAAGAEQ